MSETNHSSQSIDLAEIRAKLQSSSGRQYWKSLEEVAGTPEFQDILKHEFPSEADTFTDSVGRRHFLTIMGASLALAGVTGCTRQPKEYILPFAAQPEEAVPGLPRYFATAMPFAGIGEPLLAECHQNRPTKLEGNPEHPLSMGATSLQAQASVLNMYDPDRLRAVVTNHRDSSWTAFTPEFRRQASLQAQKGGTGLRILSGSSTSPTFKATMDRVMERFPGAVWHQWEPVNRDAAVVASEACFGQALDTHYDLKAAKVILSLDADFLANTPGAVRTLRDFANGRHVENGQAGNMNRLYVAEAAPTVTGASADHRLRIKASEVEVFAAALAERLGVSTGATVPALPEKAAAWIEPLAADLQRAGATAVVIPGDQQTAGVHALAHAINAQLGAVGTTVSYAAPVDIAPVNQLSSLGGLVSAMNDGSVEMLVILGGNPVYDAPGDAGFRDALLKVPFRVMLSEAGNETSVECHWQLPAAHYLEAWGDIKAKDGSVILQQPMIEPLFGGKSQIELLSMLTEEDASGRDLVRATFAASSGLSGTAMEPVWRKALHDGVVAGTAATPVEAALSVDWTRLVSLAPSAGTELVIRPDSSVWDGTFSNNGWMQELPKPITKLVWENVVQVSPATAQGLSLRNGEVVELGRGGQKVRGPVWIAPGQADDVILVHLGYGRTHAGRVCEGIGFNAYALQTSDARWHASSLEFAKRGEFAPPATVQDHGSMEGRHLVRIANATEYQEHPNFAQMVGHGAAEGHEPPPGVGSPFVGGLGSDAEHGPKADVKFQGERSEGTAYADVENDKSFFPEYNYTGNAWGLTIDLNRCVGCNACMAACQSENNLPVVGKDQVARGREMHWIRIDRYFEGDLDDPATVYQPLTCMQCENAPCEPVCPVGATVHSVEGLNDMVYNRCVGTRYCSNNCPYKVRRFNFLLYQDFETDTFQLQRNPDVTVRSRGVMEKCTYCVQRINYARATAEKEGNRAIRDGEILTACQQVCPAEAITFGNINDPEAKVTKLKKDPRNYGLLEELNTQPRTTYLARVTNPNPEMPVSGAGANHGEEHSMAAQATEA